VEVQFHNLETFYANLFAKVFLVLESNPSFKEWAAVAIFESRNLEPKNLEAYEDLLRSKRVTRIYLDEYAVPANPSAGLGLLQLVSAPRSEIHDLVADLQHKTDREIADSEMAKKVIELAEELLMRRFTEFGREEIRKMFGLQDIRKSKVWQEALEEGEHRASARLIRKWLAKGKSVKEIAELMDLPIKEVRRLVKDTAK
jgi:predicted transposase/invertase (TIGR01784 family)